jgi:nucleotide-binding universal stress UspA family protein
MFSRTVVATDFSPASATMLKCLGGLKAYGVERLVLLLCMPSEGAFALDYATDFAEKVLAQQKQLLEAQGLVVETRIVLGPAAHEIHNVASEEGSSLVVIGSRGHSRVAEPFLGGVASEVIHRYHETPLLVMRIGSTADGATQCLGATPGDLTGHVLFPTDFSDNADHAFSYVRQMAAAGAKRVTLLHVQDVGPHLEHRLPEFDEIDGERLAALAGALAEAGSAEVELKLVYGQPFVEITRLVREAAVSVVVMGSQGRGFVRELFLGSVSHNVARHAEAPVLLVPPLRADA